MSLQGPRRIVCLSDEVTEILYGLGEADRIVGISAFTTRPPQAREEKTIVTAFKDGSVDKIAALRPDMVIGFSDVQADLAARLIRAHLPVMIFNQRSLAQIFESMVSLGQLVGRAHDAQAWASRLREGLDETRRRFASSPKVRVYFEEWYDPLICGIEWVSELIAIAGGQDVFAELARAPGCAGRVLSSEAVIAADPQLMLASWCGAPFEPTQVEERPGFSELNFVREGAIRAIPSSMILQPGPAALGDGLDALVGHIEWYRASRPD